MKLTVTKHRLLMLLLVGSGLTTLLGSGLADRLRHWAHPALAPAGDGMMYLTTLVRREARDLTDPGLTGADARRLREENEEFAGRVKALEAALLARIRQQQAVDTLFGRLGSNFPCQPIPARVIGAGSLPYDATRMLNIGTRRDAGEGQFVTTRRLLTDRGKALPTELAVLTTSALVGRITSAGPFTAHLQLVTDKNFKLAAHVLRRIDPARPRRITIYTASGGSDQMLSPANNRAIPVQVEGDGREHLVVRNVEKAHGVLPGDVLTTAGEDGFLPGKQPIGSVVEAIDDVAAPGFVTLKIKPHADLNSLREVYIIYPLGLPVRGSGSVGGGR